jgi:hypothetical protein
MSSTVKGKIRYDKQSPSPMWDLAITEAKEKLGRTKLAARGLRKAIAKLQRLKGSGQPWLGQESAG